MSTPMIQLSHADWMAAVEREEQAFWEKLPELLDQFEGEYAAMFRGELVGHHKDESVLYGEMLDKLGYVPFAIYRVSKDPEVLEIELFEQLP